MNKSISFILPYIPVISSGGVIVVFKYAELLVKDGYDVTIYFKTETVWKEKRIKFPAFFRKGLGVLGTAVNPRWYKLDKRIKKRSLFYNSDIKKHDIIIATGIETVSDVVKYSLDNAKKYYLIQDFENWDTPDNEVYKTYNMGLNNIVISKWLLDVVKNNSNSIPVYIPDGIDTDIFSCKNSINNRKKHSIVFHYREAVSKGCKYAIEVVEKLHNRYPDLEVSIISKMKRSEIIPTWCNYFCNISLDDVAKINNQSEIFICTSINEGFGLPGLEAMACGCAVCTTDYLGGQEYAVDRYNSLVSPIKDVEKMCENIIELFENDSLKKEIITNGLNTANKFSLKNSYEKFSKTLNS